MSDIEYFSDIWGVFSEYAVSFVAEKAVKKLLEAGGEELVKMVPYAGTICTIASLLYDTAEAATQNPLQYVDPDTWVLFTGTAWTYSYIEIYDTDASSWYAVQCSSYAVAKASMYSSFDYDSEANEPMQLGGILRSDTVYSTYYSDTATRKLQAVQAALAGNILVDSTGDIEYYFTNPEDSTAKAVLIFTHKVPL